MGHKSIKVQVIVLFSLIIANFIAQIPYYLDVYAGQNHVFIYVRSFLILLALLVVLLIAFWQLLKRTRLGYWLMFAFLAVEFLFYLGTVLIQALQGAAFLHHLQRVDLVTNIVFAVGYLNLFVSGYFLYLLLFQRSHFLGSKTQERLLPQTSVLE